MAVEIPGQPEGSGEKTQAELVEAFQSMTGTPDTVDEKANTTPTEASEDQSSDPAVEGEELEASDDETEETVGDEETKEVDEEPDTYTVKANGKELEVTLDELLSGYSRTADYTRHRMEDAEKAKAVDAKEETLDSELSRVRENNSKYEEGLDQFLDFVQGQGKIPPPDLDKVKAGDQDAIAGLYSWQVQQQQKQDALAQKQQLQAQREQEASTARAKASQESLTHLTETIPGWTDDDTRKKGLDAIRDHIIASGFTPEIADSLTDHKILTMAYQSDQWVRLQKKTKAAGKERRRQGKPLKAGSPKASKPDPKSKAIQEKFRQSGRTDDAVAAFLQLGG